MTRTQSAVREAMARPTRGDADRRQSHNQPGGFPGIWRDEVWQALREDAASARRLAAHELPHGEVDVGAHEPQDRSVGWHWSWLWTEDDGIAQHG